MVLGYRSHFVSSFHSALSLQDLSEAMCHLDDWFSFSLPTMPHQVYHIDDIISLPFDINSSILNAFLCRN